MEADLVLTLVETILLGGCDKCLYYDGYSPLHEGGMCRATTVIIKTEPEDWKCQHYMFDYQKEIEGNNKREII